MVTKKKTTARLIPAVGYLRRSTRGKKADGKERQEKSISQQKTEIEAFAKGRFRIIRWYEDSGVSGWKREAERPGFAKILADAHEKADFSAIVTDDADRFTRASWRKATRDIDDLAEAGVQIISSVKDGDFDISNENDAGDAHRFIAVAMMNHEFSRKLSRRVTIARRNKEREGKRTGGPAPYGYLDDGNGGLKLGSKEERDIVRFIFDQFANKAKSLHWISGDLNRRGNRTRKDSEWSTNTLAQLIRRRVYTGDFEFNKSRVGRFFHIDEKGEVAEEVNGQGKVFKTKDVYQPIVDRKVFDKAQRRLEALSTNRSRRKRAGYALTGVLQCGHCGESLTGATKNGVRVYLCTKTSGHGAGTCIGTPQVREDAILPFVMKLLGEEITERKILREMLAEPPDDLRTPWKENAKERKSLEAEQTKLKADVKTAERNVLTMQDARTRKSLDGMITEMRDRLDEVDAELANQSSHRTIKFNGQDFSIRDQDEQDAFREWWDEFRQNAVTLPIAHYLFPDECLDETDTLMDAKVVNDVLEGLGCKVVLQWKTVVHTSRNGREYNRHLPHRGRFQLGKQKGRITRNVLEPSACRDDLPRARPCGATSSRRGERTDQAGTGSQSSYWQDRVPPAVGRHAEVLPS